MTSETRNADNGLISRSVVTRSGDGLSAAKAVDLDGDADVDVSANTVTLANGSVQTTTSTYVAATGTLQSTSTAVVSGNGLSTTIDSDLNGDGTIDRRSTDVTILNADGSGTRTVTTYKGPSTVEGKTTTTTSGDGLTILTVWEALGQGVTRSRTETVVVNADGSTTKTVSESECIRTAQ
ncbi:hypothetical protein N8D56_25530 (plasmid) [Devosia sp. A8/3-2]|nr:hypothetical protein N8D56_25530 [Devosia sp. A8/3-2]